MAIMYPSDINTIHFNNETEKTMYKELKRQLPDYDHVYYSIRWFDKDENNNDTVESECDFLVYDPQFGFLVIEVKGGTGLSVDSNGRWTLHLEGGGTMPEGKGPYVQAENCMRYFVNCFERTYGRRYKGTYGFATAFPRFYLTSPITTNGSPLEVTIDKSYKHKLNEKIREIFLYWRKHWNIDNDFPSEQQDDFLDLIDTDISVAAAAGALIEEKESEFSKIDFAQDSILDLLYNYPQVRIMGGAGTGKTFIAIKKAIRDAKSDKKVLFLCSNNRELLNFVKGKVHEKVSEGVDFKTYDDLIIGSIGPEAYDGASECFDLISNKRSDINKYDSIIIDEAQDFNIDMGLTTRCYLRDENTSTLYVFYDVNQDLYGCNIDDVFGIKDAPFLLRYNIRNTKEIYKYATRKTGLGKDTISNQIQGARPDKRRNSTDTETIKELNNIVEDLIGEQGVSNHSIVILSNNSFENSILSHESRIYNYNISYNTEQEIGDNDICYRTVKEFKGLEADVIIYLEDDDPSQPHDKSYKRREYIAYTRARYCLYILLTEK